MTAAALAARWVPFHPFLLLFPALTVLLMRRFPLRSLFLFSLFLVSATWRLHPPANDLRRVIPLQPANMAVEFDVAGDVVTTSYGSRVPVRIRRVQYVPEWQEVTARVQLRFDGPPPDGFLPGTRWRTQGRLDPRPLTFTGLRRADWLLRADARQFTPLAYSRTRFFQRGFYRIREDLSRRLARAAAADPEAGDVLQALLLARRGDVDDVWTTAFARTGLIHIFAVSGLHLGILTVMLLWVCKRIGVPYRYRAFAVIPVLFLFTAATGFRASALRALLMASCLISAPLFYRRSDPRNAFALALFLLLAWAPEQLFDIGFQFSFLLVGGLLAVGALFQTRLAAALRGDPWSPPEVQWPWWKEKLLWPVCDTFAVSFLCFLFSAPLTAHTFNLFSPVALLGNLLAVPLAFLLLACGFPGLFFLAGPAPLAAAALLPARLTARALLEWVSLLEAVPGGVLWVRSPAVWQVAALYGLPFVAFRFAKCRKICLAAGLIAIGFSVTRWTQHQTRSELLVLDADRGQSAMLRAGARGTVLIDAGSDWSGRTVADALKSEGVNRVEALFLTHPNRAHVEGVASFLDTHPPRRIYVAQPDADHALYAGLDAVPLQAGDRFLLAGWQVDVLWPPADWPARAAGNRSLVLRFSRGRASVTVMGGADERVEAEMLARDGVLPTRLLLAANSPRVPSASQAFLRGLRPEAAVFAGQEFGGPGEARQLSETRVRRENIALWTVLPHQPLRLDVQRGTQIPAR
ncbi:MAG: ComEC/Rec2 family competence protein [Verrucomicrobia bacterium]|nr:ComEC/Rec2 family competence protein [Verrucomicrobiota bacterium]